MYWVYCYDVCDRIWVESNTETFRVGPETSPNFLSPLVECCCWELLLCACGRQLALAPGDSIDSTLFLLHSCKTQFRERQSGIIGSSVSLDGSMGSLGYDTFIDLFRFFMFCNDLFCVSVLSIANLDCNWHTFKNQCVTKLLRNASSLGKHCFNRRWPLDI